MGLLSQQEQIDQLVAGGMSREQATRMVVAWDDSRAGQSMESQFPGTGSNGFPRQNTAPTPPVVYRAPSGQATTNQAERAVRNQDWHRQWLEKAAEQQREREAAAPAPVLSPPQGPTEAARKAAIMAQFDQMLANAAQRFAQQRALADSFGTELGALVDRLRGELPGRVANLQGIYANDTADTRAAIAAALPNLNNQLGGTLPTDVSMAVRGVNPEAIRAAAAEGGQWAGQAAGALGNYADEVVQATNRYGGDASAITDSVMAAARSQVEANRAAMLSQLLGQETDLMSQLGLQRAQAEQSQYNADREFALREAQMLAESPAAASASNEILVDAIDSAIRNIPSHWGDWTRYYTERGVQHLLGDQNPNSAFEFVLSTLEGVPEIGVPSAGELALIQDYLNEVYGRIITSGG